ncbi:hypothetical protein GCM10009839_30250 [Catenulispora yoronensis]|uniref:GPP34 family phosphoprotein n=1 Tax=Catenulispora yoronensis TaxID=450799 RepID=A0ABN2U611_9ACTN
MTRTGTLFDDFFLMVHDDPSGRPRLPGRILGLGLACAQLAELARRDAIRVTDGTIMHVTAASESEPISGLLGEVLGAIKAEPGRPVRDWLDFLGGSAAQRIGNGLGARKQMYFKPSRLKPFSRAGRWIPADSVTATWPAIEVDTKVCNGRAETPHLLLLGLARATGLDHPALWNVRGLLADPAAMAEVLTPLTEHPPLLELLNHTTAAVASAVTSQRSP